MINLYKKSEEPETSEDLGKALVHLIEENLDVKRWNFQLSFSDFSKMSGQKVIYDSSYCRVSFSFSRQRLPEYDELHIEYGRLHAPNEGAFMDWQGQKCHSWHRVLVPLRFLDGLSPQEAVEQVKIYNQLPVGVKDFNASDIGTKLQAEYHPKYVIVLQSAVWNYYGQRLFDLFDLRRPDLWEEYRKYLKEYYKLLGMKASYGPPYENVC
jgi:hypothetical protein